MLRLLTQFFSRRAAKRFERERALFRFFDGTRWRAVDPWSTWRAIAGCETFDFKRQGFLVDQSSEPETSHCIAALCQIFGVSRYDDSAKTGLTDWEIISLYLDLSAYLEALKKNTSPGPISSPPSARASSPEEDTFQESRDGVTSSCSASGSTPNAASCDKACAS